MSPGHPVRAVSRRDAPAVARLRALCLGFPDANERLSHGEPTWFAGRGKAFAMLDNHHHGSEHLSVWLPMPPGTQGDLVTADGERFFRPPYVGGAGWVGVVLDGRPDWALVAKLVREAFLHVAGARLRARLDPRPAPGPARRPRSPRGRPARSGRVLPGRSADHPNE